MRHDHRVEIFVKTLSGQIETLSITVSASSDELFPATFARALRRNLEEGMSVSAPMSIELIRDYPVKNENQ